MDMVLRTPTGRGAAGLTLIEVLVAVTILGVALLALFPMFTNAVRSNASANQLTSSITLAREKLEELSGYPRSDPRLTVADTKNAAGPPGTTISGAAVDTTNAWCLNDLPAWYNPKTGATLPPGPHPGPGWFSYPFTRTYTIEQFDGTLATRVTSPNPYVVKLITVTVRPTSGPFPGLRESRQSLYLRVSDV
jgi:prepilin-type N-terminal cleavage/methylation domain-containing protein